MSFRDNLQHLRATRNMTQEQLAMLLGVSRQSVTKWEAQKSYPEMDKLLKMCAIFDCTLDDLVQGDLTGREPEISAATVPAGPPTDICGYDEHQRMMAWKVPTGISAILLAIAIALFFDGIPEFDSAPWHDGIFALIVLMGVLAGLAFLVPAGMEHAAFQKAHPFVEDFYTDNDKAQARKAFSGGLIAGIGPVADGINWLNAKLGEAWEFLATIHLATVIYYVILFVAVQLLRLLIVKCISHLFSLDVLPMRILNGALGAVLMVAAVFLLLLLVFAIVAVFGDTAAVQSFAESIEGTFLGTLYTHNPVQLAAIFGGAAA